MPSMSRIVALPGEPARRAAGVRRRAEQPADALEERAAGGGHRQKRLRPGRAAQLLEIGQRVRVGVRIAAQAHRQIVAAVLALDADPARQPPHRRVIEEQRLDERLQQVDEVVVAADVRQLVREDRLELLRRQSSQRARRKQHDRLEPADHRRHVDERRLEQPDVAGDVQPARQARRDVLPARRRPATRRATSSAAPTASRSAAAA